MTLRGAAYLWLAAALLLAYSVGWAVQPLLGDGPEIGQSLGESIAERASFSDTDLRDALFTSVVTASEENRQILAKKTTYVWRSVRWTAVALLLAALGTIF